MWWIKKDENKKTPNVDWKKSSESGKDLHFKGKIFGKNVNITQKTLQKIAFGVSILLVLLLIKNVFYIFTPLELSNTVKNKTTEYIDNDKLMDEGNILKIKNIEKSLYSKEKKKNKLLKKAAYDSLIDNQLLSPETSKIIEETYPDSICGC